MCAGAQCKTKGNRRSRLIQRSGKKQTAVEERYERRGVFETRGAQ
jgi:hypothetical protein